MTSSSKNPFAAFSGDCLEFEVELSFDESALCELSVRATPDGAECTTISYDSGENLLTVDGSKSSLDPDARQRTFSGRLAPDQNGVVRFRAFLDRSVMEVFLADSACITQRMYPTREDSHGREFRGEKGFGTHSAVCGMEIGFDLAWSDAFCSLIWLVVAPWFSKEGEFRSQESEFGMGDYSARSFVTTPVASDSSGTSRTAVPRFLLNLSRVLLPGGTRAF